MNKPTRWIGAAVLAASMPLSAALAADHLDSPSVQADPAGDITDLYAWVGADQHVRLVLDVSPLATSTTQFSMAAQYVFHVESAASYGTAAATSRTIVCQPYGPATTATGMECWIRDQDGTVLDYVGGDASATAGITSASGSVRLFAGLRDDPFFFNLDGFRAAQTAVIAASSSLTFDAAGCPALSASTSAALVSQLSHNPHSTPPGGTAQDFFAGTNVLAIVLEIDPALLHSSGNDTVSVWASSHQAP